MSANDSASVSSSDDAKNPAKQCPLKKTTVQLLPLRFGLVEKLDIHDTIQLPYKTKSKPLGLRLIRDGWLYFIFKNEGQWILYEYFVKDGEVEKLLWQGDEITSDTRTTSLGENKIIVPKVSEMYIGYSEIQWTAKKCSQVIKNEKDREQFLKKIDTKNINAQKGNKSLLIPDYAKELIAEVSEEQDQERKDYYFSPYEWEDIQKYKKVDFPTLNGNIDANYQGDALYVIFNDDIGVLRDLAQYQDLAVEALNNWHDDDVNYQKYQEGMYINSQVEISTYDIDSLSMRVGDADLPKKLSDDQKSSLARWIEFLSKPQRFPNEKQGKYSGEKAKIIKSLGRDNYDKYEPTIDAMISDYQRNLNGVSYFNFLSSKAGTPGVLDVVHYKKMTSYLAEQKEKLTYWQEIISKVSIDRVNLFTRFYSSAWYYDLKDSVQIEALLSSEYSCIRDICINEESTKKVSEVLNRIPWISYRGIYSLDYENRIKVIENLLTNLKNFTDIKEATGKIKEINIFVNNINSVIQSSDINQDFVNINENTTRYNQLINQSYFNVIHDDALNNLSSKLQKTTTQELLKMTNSFSLFEMCKSFSEKRLKIEFSNYDEMSDFYKSFKDLLIRKKENISLANMIRERATLLRKKGININSDVKLKELKEQRKQNKIIIKEIEIDINSKTSIVSSSNEKYGIFLSGLTTDEIKNVRSYLDDMNNPKKISSLSGLDYLSAGLLILSLYNSADLTNKFIKNNPSVSGVDLSVSIISSISSSIALVQGIKSSIYTKSFQSAITSESKFLYSAKVGKVTLYLGTYVFLFSTIASSGKVYKAASDLVDSYEKNDTKKMIKAALDLGTETPMLAINGYGFTRTAIATRAVMLASAGEKMALLGSQGAKLLSLTGRLNLIGLGITIIQQIGTVWYNTVFVSDHIKWMKESSWGKDSKNLSYQESKYELACITSLPFIQMEDKINSKNRLLNINFPALTKDEVEKGNVKIGFYIKDVKWRDCTELFLMQSILNVSTNGVSLSYEINNNDIEKIDKYEIAIEYLPTPGGKKKKVYFQLGNGSDGSIVKDNDFSELEYKEITLKKIDFVDMVKS